MNYKEKINNKIFNKTNGFFEKSDNFLSKNVGPYILGFILTKFREDPWTRNIWES